MRGEQFHNQLASAVGDEIAGLVSSVQPEFMVRRHGATTFFDLFVQCGPLELGIEVETTLRHARENIRKAMAVGIPVWVVVPRRKMKQRLQAWVKSTQGKPPWPGIKILLLGEIRKGLTVYLSERITISNKE